MSSRSLRAFILPLALAALLGACKRPFAVGDHVMVEWEGQDYPAMILKLEGASKLRVHFDGYDDVWDETVARNRVHGLVEGNPPQPEPPAKVRAKALAAAKSNAYKIGDRVRIEWHGQIYPGTITAIVGPERYRVHYEGYGSEWDEIVGLPRLQTR